MGVGEGGLPRPVAELMHRETGGKALGDVVVEIREISAGDVRSREDGGRLEVPHKRAFGIFEPHFGVVVAVFLVVGDVSVVIADDKGFLFLLFTKDAYARLIRNRIDVCVEEGRGGGGG